MGGEFNEKRDYFAIHHQRHTKVQGTAHDIHWNTYKVFCDDSLAILFFILIRVPKRNQFSYEGWYEELIEYSHKANNVKQFRGKHIHYIFI